jgi:hypothetical protein
LYFSLQTTENTLTAEDNPRGNQRIFVRRLLILALLSILSSSAGAQIIRGGGMRLQEPSAWVSLGAASLSGFTVTDGSTNSVWQFGNSTQYTASLEKTLSGGTSLGIQGTTAHVPLSYSSRGSATFTDADANVSQLYATLHVASGREFHSVLELSAGATVYSGFRARTTGAALPPTSPDADFTFAFGYGLGYTFNSAFSIDVIQDLTTALHQRTGLSAGDNSSVRLNGTRIVARFGLGGR